MGEHQIALSVVWVGVVNYALNKTNIHTSVMLCACADIKLIYMVLHLSILLRCKPTS